MVSFTGTAIVAILAATASADHQRYGRRHIHARSYPVASPPGEYPTASEVPATSSAPATVPEASGSAYATAPHGYPHHSHHHHPSGVPSGPESVPSAASSSAPYGYGNSTVPGPIGTGTGVFSTPEVPVSTATVVPVGPESSPASIPAASSGAAGGNGYPTSGVPSGLPGATGADVCGPATVTVTVTPGTITVTAGESSSAVVPPAGPSSVPEGETSSAGVSYPAASPSSPASSAPVESASTPAASTPVASESSVAASTPASYPAATPATTESTPETTPVVSESTPATAPVASESESETAPAYTPAPTSEVATTPIASSSSYAATSALSTPSSSPVSGSKRGIVYQEQSDLKNIGDCGWGWNWNSNDFGMSGSWNYVPIVNNMEQAPGFASAAQKSIASAPAGSKYAMGFNEPDMSSAYGGSGMSASDAAANYIKYVNPIKGAQLGSISITSTENDANAGLPYLKSWKESCDAQGGCTVDFVCIHWYGNPSQTGDEQADGFISYIKKAITQVHELWGEDMKIWVTEFAAKPDLNVDATNHPSFIKKTLEYLDNENNVERYAYFMASPGYLMDADGTLNDAGTAYFG